MASNDSDSTWLTDNTDDSSSTDGSSDEDGGNAGGNANGAGDPAVVWLRVLPPRVTTATEAIQGSAWAMSGTCQ